MPTTIRVMLSRCRFIRTVGRIAGSDARRVTVGVTRALLTDARSDDGIPPAERERRIELRADLGGARDAIAGRPREHVRDQRIEPARQARDEVAHVRRRLVQPAPDHLLARFGVERLRAA